MPSLAAGATGDTVADNPTSEGQAEAAAAAFSQAHRGATQNTLTAIRAIYPGTGA